MKGENFNVVDRETVRILVLYHTFPATQGSIDPCCNQHRSILMPNVVRYRIPSKANVMHLSLYYYKFYQETHILLAHTRFDFLSAHHIFIQIMFKETLVVNRAY